LKTIEKLRQLHPRLLFFSHDGTGDNPEKLISEVAENTKYFGEIILKALKRGETIETINSRLKVYISNRFGKDLGGLERTMTARGYIHYFEKKGLV
jgi:hypothetical protein